MTTPPKPLEKFVPNPKLKLREQLGEVMRFKHLSHRTEGAYWCWIKGFILFHQKRHPRDVWRCCPWRWPVICPAACDPSCR